MLSETQNNQVLQILSATSATFEKSLESLKLLFRREEYFSVCWGIQHWLELDVLVSLT